MMAERGGEHEVQDNYSTVTVSQRDIDRSQNKFGSLAAQDDDERDRQDQEAEEEPGNRAAEKIF